MAEEAQQAKAKLEEQEKKEKQRLHEEAEATAEAERLANEQRALEEAKRPKKWDVMRSDMKVKKKKKMVKHMLKRTDTQAIHDAIKIENQGARQLAYATPDVYFRGLAKIIGRAGTDAGNDPELMRLMKREHVRTRHMPPTSAHPCPRCCRSERRVHVTRLCARLALSCPKTQQIIRF